jgi:hypothetical protein
MTASEELDPSTPIRILMCVHLSAVAMMRESSCAAFADS